MTPKTKMNMNVELTKSRNTMASTINHESSPRRRGNHTSSLFNKGKHATINFDNLMVPEARETFFNKRIISSSYATSRKRLHLRG